MSSIPEYQDTVEREPTRRETFVMAGKTGYDLVYGFFTDMKVQTILTLIILFGGNALLGWPFNPLVVALGFIVIGLASWIFFPSAAWNWEIETNLSRRLVRIRRITVEDSIENLNEQGAIRIFEDGKKRTVTVKGEHLPISQSHTISDLDYLADTETLKQALAELPAIVLDYAILKSHRGLETSTLAIAASESAMKAFNAKASDDIRGLKDDITQTAGDDPGLRDSQDATTD